MHLVRIIAPCPHLLEEHSIPIEWLERTLREPMVAQTDARDPELEHRYRKIAEFDDRVLHVVVNISVAPVRVVSVYFDRGQRGKL